MYNPHHEDLKETLLLERVREYQSQQMQNEYLESDLNQQEDEE